MGADRSVQGWLGVIGTTRIAVLAFACMALWLLAIAPTAGAAAHPRSPALDVEGLSHACGVAVDSKGDLYAASAGDEEVRIYKPADHTTPIGEVANSNEPCGLAIDSKGTLYVSERVTGFVVRYLPTKYPFEGAPSYGPREVIDSSGGAEGISVDPSEDRLYVAAGGHVTAYDSEGNLGVDEVQGVLPFFATGGTYVLIYEGEKTPPLPYKATHEEVKKALEELAAIGAGNVSVGEGNPGAEGNDHVITFIGALGASDVPSIECDKSALEGGSAQCITGTEEQGFSGLIGEGDLTEATGVAAYTYKATATKPTYRLAVTDAAGDELKLFSAPSFKAQQLRTTLTGPEEGEQFGFGVSGAYLAADPGACPPTGQACTAGHLYLYDDAHEEIDELEATGALVSQTPFTEGDGAPTAIAVDRSDSEDDGTLYATTGAKAEAAALAFSPLEEPERSGPEAPPLSLELAGARAIAVDDHGNRYVGKGPEIKVFAPKSGEALATIAAGATVLELEVDSACNVYARFTEEAAYFKPSACPPTEGTTYGTKTTVSKKSQFKGTEPLRGIAVDPTDDHLFVTDPAQTIEYASAKAGSGILDEEFGAGLGIPTREGIAAYGADGSAYISAEGGQGGVYVVDSTGDELLTRISGAGAPSGGFGAHPGALAVDQSNGHFVTFEPGEAAKEYEASGTFVGEYGSSTLLVTSAYGVAVDNGSESPNKGTVYVAFDDTNPEVNPYDLTAFGGLEYPEGEPLPKHLLKVKKTGTGSGTVTSSPEGIDCGATCEAPFEEGTKVTLQATPAEGSEFSGWEGCDSEPEGNCKVSMTEAREVSASFKAKEAEGIPLKVALEGTGSGTVASNPGLISCEPFCEDSFPEGTEVTLTASPSPGSLFVAWKHCDKGGVNGRQCTLSTTEAKEVSAVFIVAYDLTLAKAEGSGPGILKSKPGGAVCLFACTATTASFREGKAIEVQAKPAKHFHLTAWGGDCEGTGPCEVTMGEGHEVSALFAEDPRLPLTLSKEGGGQALIKTRPAGLLCSYTCTEATASLYEGEAFEVKWKLAKGTTSLTWTEGSGTCTGTTEALEGSCTLSIEAPTALGVELE